MKVKFKQMIGNSLRTKEVDGECKDLPVVGRNFNLFAEGLEIPGSTRIISTNIVKEIVSKSNYDMLFTTLSGSLYHLTFLEEPEVQHQQVPVSQPVAH